MENSNRIPLIGLRNTRDLGGFCTKDGRKVQRRRCIRSGELSPMTERDKKTLLEEYNLRAVIDFRTQTERAQKPDPILPGVHYFHNPILLEQTLGITRERPGDGVIASFLEAINGTDFTGNSYMAAIYSSLVSEPYSQRQYGRFFDLLLEQEEGAVLWHCSAGKDRVGVGTVLFLTALGVSEEDAAADYLMTNTYLAADIRQMVGSITASLGSDADAEEIAALFSVQEAYIDAVFRAMKEACGSTEGYLRQAIGLSEEKLERLKGLYLE